MKTNNTGVGHVETRGIEPVPDEERHGGPLSLFWTWFGANMGVLGITLGAVLVTFTGLNVVQSVAVAGVGSVVSFLLVAVIGTAGRTGGAPGLTLSRSVFGVRGNWGPTLVSWLSFVGWETIMCTTAAFALLRVVDRWGTGNGPMTIGLCLITVVALSAGIGLFGHATIMWMQKWLTLIFGGLTVIVVAFLSVRVHWAGVLAAPAGGLAPVMSGIGFIAAGTGLGWLSAGPDYARYLPRGVRTSRMVLATVTGSSIPLVVLTSLGALMAIGDSGLASANDPVAAIGASLPSWMLVPYLLTAVFGLIAGADLSMYSSGLNLITGGIKVRRTTAVAVDAVLITIGGLYITVIAQDFYGPFITFLTLLAVPLTSWAGVFAVDMAARRQYDPQGLLDTQPGSRYWYSGGVRWSALVGWLSGIALALLFTRAQAGDAVWFAGPLSTTWLGRNSFGWLVAGGTAAVVFSLARALGDRRSAEPTSAAALDRLGADSDG